MQAALASVNCGLKEKPSVSKKAFDLSRSLTGRLTANHFRLEYPEEQKKAYDAVITRLVSSFRSTAAAECRQ